MARLTDFHRQQRGSSRGSSRRSSSTTPPRVGSSSTTSPTPRIQVPWHVARLVTRLLASLVIDYSASRRLVIDYLVYTVSPGASTRCVARHAARRTARRQLLRLAQARRRLLRLRHASRCLGTSRGSSRGSSHRSSSTTSTTPCVRVPRHVAWLVMRLVAPLVVDYFRLVQARRRLLRLLQLLLHVARLVTTTCLAATLALLRVRRAPPRRRLPVASR
jgi:hypothetical protein